MININYIALSFHEEKPELSNGIIIERGNLLGESESFTRKKALNLARKHLIGQAVKFINRFYDEKDKK